MWYIFRFVIMEERGLYNPTRLHLTAVQVIFVTTLLRQLCQPISEQQQDKQKHDKQHQDKQRQGQQQLQHDKQQDKRHILDDPQQSQQQRPPPSKLMKHSQLHLYQVRTPLHSTVYFCVFKSAL